MQHVQRPTGIGGEREFGILLSRGNESDRGEVEYPLGSMLLDDAIDDTAVPDVERTRGRICGLRNRKASRFLAFGGICDWFSRARLTYEQPVRGGRNRR